LKSAHACSICFSRAGAGERSLFWKKASGALLTAPGGRRGPYPTTGRGRKGSSTNSKKANLFPLTRTSRKRRAQRATECKSGFCHPFRGLLLHEVSTGIYFFLERVRGFNRGEGLAPPELVILEELIKEKIKTASS